MLKRKNEHTGELGCLPSVNDEQTIMNYDL